MKVAILGSGNVGAALGARLAASGIEARFGARAPAGRPSPVAGVAVAAPREAAAAADLVLVAVPAAAAIEAARACGDLSGKALVDCTNPLRWEGGPVWSPPREGSVAQALAAALPGVAVVKGFNHFGAEIMADPRLRSAAADALFAGDDAGAKRRAMELASRMGFAPHDAGPLRNAAALENLAVLWIQLAGARGRRFAFRVEDRA